MSRHRHQPLTPADVTPELILAGAEVGWVRSSGAARRPEREGARRFGSRRRRSSR